ncbi:MAG: YvcK family protein, partial [Candidatus Omnitrophica bacterium]|nr:YvcK family protein [Candidatus Omnitrophota bacterium]
NNADTLSIRKSINRYKLKNEIYDESLYAALIYLNSIKITVQWNNFPIEKRIDELYRIYKDYNLAFTSQAAWTVLYRHAFDFSPELNKALDEVELAFADSGTVEEFFKKADEIYKKCKDEKGVDFFRFYSSIDPRLAKNLYFLRMKVYKDNAQLINDVYTAADYKKESVSRTLVGYFQDRYIYASKQSGIAELNKPDPEVTYVGGGGVATTTFLRTLVEKGIKSVAGLVSSSDDGGSSWKIMLAISKTFGFYFIPPGDAAGVIIFTGADDAKVFSLFEIESREDLPEDLSTAGKRITADNVLPVWKQRIIDVNRVFNGQTNATNLPTKPKDFIAFASGLMTLGDLIDRELIDTNIMQLEGMSTANLLVMGAAFEQGALKHGKLFDEKTMKLDNLDRLIGAKEQQTLAVSWDYQRSCLVATYEDGTKIPFQTLITDRLHPQFLVDLDFQIRTGDKDYSEFKNDDDLRNATKEMAPKDYPKANLDVVKAIENTKGAIIMGNGSLFTSMLPNLLYSEISEAIIKKRKQGLPVVFIVKIKSDIETSKGLKIVDEQNNIYQDDDAIENAAGGTKFYLEISETMPLKKQLEIIRNVVKKAITRNDPKAIQRLLGKDKLELKDIISHIIMPDQAFSKMIAKNKNSNRVAISDKVAAKKLSNSLNKGEAQVSKQVKGFQKISTKDRNYVAEQGISVLAVSKQGITGIADQKPMYNNETLYEITKKLIAEHKKSKILCVCNSNYNRSPAMQMVFEHLIEQNGLSRYVSVSSGAVEKVKKGGLGAINAPLQEAFKQQFSGKTPKQIKAKPLTAYQVQQAEVIIVPNAEVKDSLVKKFPSEISNKKIVVRDDLSKDMTIVQSEKNKNNKNAVTLFKIRQIIEEKIWPELLGSLKAIKNVHHIVSSGMRNFKPLNMSLLEEAELIEIAI